MRDRCMKRRGLLGALCLLALYLGSCRGGKKTPVYEFTQVSRGGLEKTVSSTGTLNPVATVKVLPQMSGKVEKIFTDYNRPVKKGEVLAELNTDVLRLQREQQMAQVIKARANYELQRINFQNQEKLAEKNLISDYELKNGRTTLDIQAAELAAAEANLKSIDTEINQYAFITSPIDGVVLERNVNEGDTVVDSSSSNSQAIFTLAENLEEMQIESWVGELDIASIREGQEVRFTLESLPGRSFTGRVDSIRLIPKVTNSVVSYTVIINVENRDGSLLPGMTCAVDFIVERREGVLRIPNAALRYQPTHLNADEISAMVFEAGLRGLSDDERKAALEARAALASQASGNTGPQGGQGTGTGITGLVAGPPPGMGRIMGGPGGGRQGPQGQQAGTAPQRREVTLRNGWYLSGEGKLEVMRLRTGITNGSFTEIITQGDTEESLEGTRFILREKI
jgi:HlyD family secretion protein